MTNESDPFLALSITYVDVLEYFLSQSELMYPTEFIQLYGKPPQVTLDGG